MGRAKVANNYQLDSDCADSADRAITKALSKCAKKIQEIAKKHPKCGIGDTATDEAIADEFYAMIHWSDTFLK
jgi:hypothetical protein